MLAAGQAPAFEGRYTAGDKLYSQALTITKSGGRLRGTASVATRGCVGEFDGAGIPQGEELVLRASLDGRECRLTLRRTAPSAIEVSEDQCLTFHGAACEFSGSYKRQAR
jgi:hypothetical protein